ncbi:hypothetical protein HMPREF1531_01324 [Propionibacterium sp. oral taxon 192 str. F0372]|uniref:Fe-S-containing protein n=1 Tax=Propionibacterium sp. oral taxon 192 TaxID=671222 RepID=UPI000354180F|nr:Fe-S-containing protein [Propionibacterium sp. oral taxon 192]EPH03265.1 hypothetical protein HMPREF1531_01324 [Propionibacterium sp. oral taxon 192 str. F0372]
MLSQMVEVISAVLLAGLAAGALSPAIRLAAGGDPARPGPRPVVWGVITGSLLGGAHIVLHQYSILRVNRQRMTLTTLEPTVALFIVTLAICWIFGRRTLAELHRNQHLGLSSAGIASPIPTVWSRIATVLGFAWCTMVFFRASQPVWLTIWSWVPSNSSIFSTDTFLAVLGWMTGILVCLVAGIAVRAMCQRRPGLSPALFTIMGTLLTATHLFLMLRLLVSMSAVRVTTDTAKAMSWVTNHAELFPILASGVAMGVAGLMFVHARQLDVTDTNAANHRLKQASVISMTRRSMLTLAASTVAMATLTAGKHFASTEIQLSEPEPYDMDGDNVSIALEQISDGHLHRFEYSTSQGVKVRFIVIQKAGTSFGVGLDACEICGPSGYYEEDGKVICKLCGVAMNIATIGFKGGCNPIPIDFKVANNHLTVPVPALESSAKVFA